MNQNILWKPSNNGKKKNTRQPYDQTDSKSGLLVVSFQYTKSKNKKRQDFIRKISKD